MISPSVSPTSRRRSGMDVAAVLRELDSIHQSLQVGDAFPTQRDLIERLDASERIVRGALDEFQRQGKIIRRVGRGGSVVAEIKPPDSSNDTSTYSQVHNRTIVTISEPDGSFFDRALQLLVRHPEAADMAINCRLMQREDSAAFVLPAESHGPQNYMVFGNYFVPLAQKLQSAGHRVVLIGSPPLEGPAGVPNVYCDHEEGGRLVVSHMLELGHRHFLFQGADTLQQHARWVGANHALSTSRVETKYEFLRNDGLDRWMKNPDLARDFFAHPNAPTVLVAWNDHEAVRLLTLLHRAGLKVPEDVSLIGYDNLPQGATLLPALSTVDSAIERQLRIGLQLLAKSEVILPNHTVVVMPSLVSRDSTAPVLSPSSTA